MSSISVDKSVIGWIGSGVMGAPMCGHLLDAGYRVVVYSRTAARAQPLLKKGAVWTDSVAGVAAAADVVCTMVGLPSDVRAIYFGSGSDGDGDGIIANARADALLVDFTTSSPALAVEIANAATATGRGLRALDAPVSGGDIGAREARLAVMLGGDAHAANELAPLLSVFAKNIVHQGPAGSGQHCKVVNQVLIASTMIGVCEGLLYGFAAGLDLDAVIRVVSQGAARCFSLDSYAPRILRGDYEPGFFIEHFVKDLGIALYEANAMGLVLPGAELALRMYQTLVDKGEGRRGSQALILALAGLATDAGGRLSRLAPPCPKDGG